MVHRSFRGDGFRPTVGDEAPVGRELSDGVRRGPEIQGEPVEERLIVLDVLHEKLVVRSRGGLGQSFRNGGVRMLPRQF